MTPQTNPIDPAEQLEKFNMAVALLGGQRPTAKLLNCDERVIRYLMKGERALHDGWLRDISEALTKHAQICRIVERKLNPLYRDNLTVRQQAKMRSDEAPKLTELAK